MDVIDNSIKELRVIVHCPISKNARVRSSRKGADKPFVALKKSSARSISASQRRAREMSRHQNST